MDITTQQCLMGAGGGKSAPIKLVDELLTLQGGSIRRYNFTSGTPQLSTVAQSIAYTSFLSQPNICVSGDGLTMFLYGYTSGATEKTVYCYKRSALQTNFSLSWTSGGAPWGGTGQLNYDGTYVFFNGVGSTGYRFQLLQVTSSGLTNVQGWTASNDGNTYAFAMKDDNSSPFMYIAAMGQTSSELDLVPPMLLKVTKATAAVSTLVSGSSFNALFGGSNDRPARQVGFKNKSSKLIVGFPGSLKTFYEVDFTSTPTGTLLFTYDYGGSSSYASGSFTITFDSLDRYFTFVHYNSSNGQPYTSLAYKNSSNVWTVNNIDYGYGWTCLLGTGNYVLSTNSGTNTNIYPITFSDGFSFGSVISSNTSDSKPNPISPTFIAY